MIKISIIVPAFQAEKYIGRCIESLLQQDMSEYEILCIDDGSTDRTAQIIKSHMKQDLRLRYFYQCNQGASAARNKGIQEACGEYCMFVDADDWIKKGSLKDLYKDAKKKNADILVFGGRADCLFRTPKWVREAFYTRNRMYDFQPIYALFNEPGAKPSVCNKLFRKEVIEGKRFPENISASEDLAFLCTVFPGANKICFISRTIYVYYMSNMSSAMHKIESSPALYFRQHINTVNYILSDWITKSILQENQQILQRWVVSFLDYVYVQMDHKEREEFREALSLISHRLDMDEEDLIKQMENALSAKKSFVFKRMFNSVVYQYKRYGFLKGCESLISQIITKIGGT